MNVITGIVLYAIIWFMLLFMTLPFHIQTQGEAGNKVKGTPDSAPDDLRLGRKLLVNTAIASVVFAVVLCVIVFDLVTLQDIDLFTRFGLGNPSYATE